MIEIEYGKGYSDQTFEYKITIRKPMTVGEFIKEWMTERPDEWGYFGIYDDGRTIFGNPKCEYSDGKIITDPIPDEYINAEIAEVNGSGGWTRSDFIFKPTKEEPDVKE